MNPGTIKRLTAGVAVAGLAAAACSGNVPNRAGGSVDGKVTVLISPKSVAAQRSN